MDVTAEIRVIKPSVKETAPAISVAASLVDLPKLPSYNRYSPTTSRVAEMMTSRNVEVLLIVGFFPVLIRAGKNKVQIRISHQFRDAEKFFGSAISPTRKMASALESLLRTGFEQTFFICEPQVHVGFETSPGMRPGGISISRRQAAD
jgi:hypothetical protein